MILERPISIVACSRHSSVACVSAGRGGPGCYEDFDGGSADYSIEDVGAVDVLRFRQGCQISSAYPAGADSPGGGLDDL